MATQNLTAGETVNNHVGKRTAFVVEQTVDFAKTNAAVDDVIQMLNVQPGWFVMAVLLEVLTAEGAAATGNVGDSALASGFISSANLNTLGLTKSSLTLTAGTPNTVTGYTAGKLYTVADKINLVVSAALDLAKVRMAAVVIDLS